MPRVSEQKERPLSVRLPAPLAVWVEKQAKAEGLTVSELVRHLLLCAKRGES